MKISWSQLKHLPVQTQSRQKIGIVEGVAVDVDKHSVTHYEIKPAKVLAALFSKTFLVSPAQVISISSKMMIVKDSVSPAAAKIYAKKTRLTLASIKGNAKMSEVE